ncbi:MULTISPECIES: hypothetical protein [Bacillus amyloliquefaciens group]|uniref:hypothetical protein n=1 Tax=Bacillus amyloliquefaciens group TaxID=1938374 RepID=UPI00057C1B4C|nr:hypothetical protein AAV30_02125 [Bacillus velezensis]POR15283.1 hypothetical protein B9W23_05075 [Bacillus velezensis]QCE20563.1 hypothetical protein SB21_17550 [Bacillus velezensis]QYC35187.1 hypothetical protein J5X95_07080 [Bacillus amyloliquefaciens]
MPIHIKKENPGASARDFFLFRFFNNGKAFVFVLRIIQFVQYDDGIMAQLMQLMQLSANILSDIPASAQKSLFK